ncbi:HD-GYP domain-containing protein [Zoogloea dura]|uniref:HD domain-containing protein n=1 Tax=Zoogloea dura TaxID=2728840 RepID=A0A848G0U2_9RHOO|nr:HD domain-containing phosphohydrolase [Zoogloea dura]NML24914.1 HD domain-containing protein [Zoogloea dura]
MSTLLPSRNTLPATQRSEARPAATEPTVLARELEQARRELASMRMQLTSAEAEVEAMRRERDWALRALTDLRNETFLDLARSAERHDGESPMHTTRIGLYTGLIASELGCPSGLCRMLEKASQLHDIGKIGIHSSIIGKPGPLTTEEWRVVREHPRIGASIIGESDEPMLQLAAEIAMTHHEHFNGAGYPQGLAGERIPLAGRIVGLADFFDALTTERSYRPARPVAEVIEMIRSRRGEQFDPAVVDAFLRATERIEKVLQLTTKQEATALANVTGWDGDWWMVT